MKSKNNKFNTWKRIFLHYIRYAHHKNLEWDKKNEENKENKKNQKVSLTINTGKQHIQRGENLKIHEST